ncbi:MAG TPA: S8 family serine peptidase [Candidatus Baltobacteraceae bacterium]|nr:S8 family serine peptidase [Candidatus Baltobacteraceae bacterium]
MRANDLLHDAKRILTLSLLVALAECSGGGGMVPSAEQAAAGQTAGRSTPQSQTTTILPAGARPIAAEAIPIGAEAIPIGAEAIPIVGRLLPANSTTSPKTTSVCTLVTGSGSCNAIRRLDIVPALNLLPALIAGYQPQDLWGAYDVPWQKGAGQTIGIVVAMNNPNAASDLAVYRSTMGLPPCTVASGCLRFAAQNGSSSLPAGDENWGQEMSIDLDMASAICPNCNLLVVEANSSDIENLTASVSTAISLGATVVSNSYTTPETAAVAADNPKWNHPGVPIVVGAGDNGYGVGWPASSSYVTAVGGTTLVPILDGIAVLETAWSKTGSGCSAYIAKPSWQHDVLCHKRTTNDVAAIANPVPGVAVYDTYFASSSDQGWNVYGGTSVSTPIIAGMYALAGNGSSVDNAQGLYANAKSLNNIILGLNGLCLTYLCTSGLGYSGPTGLGSPNGAGAF